MYIYLTSMLNYIPMKLFIPNNAVLVGPTIFIHGTGSTSTSTTKSTSTSTTKSTSSSTTKSTSTSTIKSTSTSTTTIYLKL